MSERGDMLHTENVRIRRSSARTVLYVRSWYNDPEQQIGVVAEDADSRTACIAPGEWLIWPKTSEASTVRLQNSPDSACVEVSAGLDFIEVAGTCTRLLLSKGCALDFHPLSFAAGRVVRTRFANIAVIVNCIEAERFELIVAQSYSTYLWRWLIDAAGEYADQV